MPAPCIPIAPTRICTTPLTMPPELRKVHQLNDKAVMEAYGFDIKATSEADCAAYLMRKYRELTEESI